MFSFTTYCLSIYQVVLFIVWAVSHFASCCHQGGMLTAFKLVMHLLFALFITEVLSKVSVGKFDAVVDLVCSYLSCARLF